MNPAATHRLAAYADSDRLARVLAIPEAHFYGLTITGDAGLPVIRSRYSPAGEPPFLIKIDSEQKRFFCTCADFQKRASYPARLGLFLCDHILRTMTMVEGEMLDVLESEQPWQCQSRNESVDREEIYQQALHYLHHCNTLAALTEIFFGIQTASLRDLDVAELLDCVDVDSVGTQDLPEAMRFVRVALQRGFAKRARELASAWLERFALSVDRFAPFADVAPVALWLKRWSGTPDIHLNSVRELILQALEKAKRQSGQGASWWLLYRAVSRSGTRPPQNCVSTWLSAVEGMKLALYHPDRIRDAVKLLLDFDINAPGPDFDYIRRHESSLQRSREWRAGYLLRLITAHRMQPFMHTEINPHVADRFVRIYTEGETTPLHQLMLSAIGYRGEYYMTDMLVENWPVIQRLCIDPPDLAIAPALNLRIRDHWPEKVTPLAPLLSNGQSSTPIRLDSQANLVVRWALASPGLIANSPLVAHHRGRIYVPTRGGSQWPEPFGLTLCKTGASLGRRLFTLQVIRRLDAGQAIQLIESGTEFAGPGDDPVYLLSKNAAEMKPEALTSLIAELQAGGEALAGRTWLPERPYLSGKIAPKLTELSAWYRRRLWETLRQNLQADHTAINLGPLFHPELRIEITGAPAQKATLSAKQSADLQSWLEAVKDIAIEVLPDLESPERPFALEALRGTALSPAIPTLVEKRRMELEAVSLAAEGGAYDLTALKNTVYGRRILAELEWLGRSKLRKAEAGPLIEALASLKLRPSGLPLFAISKKDDPGD